MVTNLARFIAGDNDYPHEFLELSINYPHEFLERSTNYPHEFVERSINYPPNFSSEAQRSREILVVGCAITCQKTPRLRSGNPDFGVVEAQWRGGYGAVNPDFGVVEAQWRGGYGAVNPDFGVVEAQ